MLEAEAKPSDDLAADLSLIDTVVGEAGEIAMRFFKRDPEVWMKNGSSPVSAADYAVDDFLRRTLRAARPDYGWLSEETADTPERLTARRTFIVDPIDGTRGFLEGHRSWCVSIAVVEDGRPLVGVLDCPAREERYGASAGGGAIRNGVAMVVPPAGPSPLVAGPKAMFGDKPPAWPADFRRGPYYPSLAYRVAAVASGALAATYVKPNANDWDLAAADLILAEAGGRVVDSAGDLLVYGGADPGHGALVAGSGPLLERLRLMLAAVSA